MPPDSVRKVQETNQVVGSLEHHLDVGQQPKEGDPSRVFVGEDVKGSSKYDMTAQHSSSHLAQAVAEDSPTSPATTTSHHAFPVEHEEARTRECHQGIGRRTSTEVDHCRTEGEVDGARGGEGHREEPWESLHQPPDVDNPIERGIQAQRGLEDLSARGVGTGSQRQQHHCSVDQAGHGEDLCHHDPIGFRPHGIWRELQHDLRGGEETARGLLSLGHQDSTRRCNRIWKVCSLAGDGRSRKEHHGCDTSSPSEIEEHDYNPSGQDRTHDTEGVPRPGQSGLGKCFDGSMDADPRHYQADGGRTSESSPRDCRREGGKAPQESRRAAEEGGLRVLYGEWESLEPRVAKTPGVQSLDTKPKTASKTKSHDRVSPSLSSFIENEANNMGPRVFQDLVNHKRTILVEVACSPESRLTSEIQKTCGYKEAAVRCSIWNGCDLTTSSGVKQTLTVLEQTKPSNVWISPECGPYSPLQAINQRTEAQSAELAEKRRQALKQYTGASIIFQWCFQHGIHVSWELAERCLAWRLPMIQRLITKYSLHTAITKGCQVGLRDPQSQGLLGKGWKIMTTHKRLAEGLNLPCRCPRGYRHVPCEGGKAGLTAYYTKEYVRRVCKFVLQELDHGMLINELVGCHYTSTGFGEGTLCVCDGLRDHDSNFTCGACHEEGQEKTRGKQGCNPGSNNNEENTIPQTIREEHVYVGQHLKSEKDIKTIDRKLYLLHAATGHGDVRHMKQALKARGANQLVLERVDKFRCTVCEESKRINVKQKASLEPLPPKFMTVCADGGKWIHPHTRQEYEFALIIDEGSRFRIARILKVGKRQTMKACEFLNYFREGWLQYFGRPSVLRLDPAGAFRSHEVESFCDKEQIFLDVIPGEAHWKLGTCEQAVQGTKEVMTKLVTSDPDLAPEAALAETIRSFNHKELVRGFSPAQHVLGRAPDETGRFIHSLTQQTVETLLANPSEEFEDTIKLQAAAEKALVDWQAKKRVTRALNSRAQKKMDYYPGDLVYFWRKQTKEKAPGKHGMFLGPARILATETKRQPDGSLVPGSAIWCVRGRRLIKCCVEQLRPASQREELLEHLSKDEDTATPWTFPRVADELGGNEYEDITSEMPGEEQWRVAQDPMEVDQPTRYRHTTKRPAEPIGEGEASSSSRPRTRESGVDTALDTEVLQEAWWNMVDEEAYQSSEGKDFWMQEHMSVEIAIDMPTTKRGMKQTVDNLEGYFLNHLKRRAVEVSEKRMTPEEYQQFQVAKQSEVKNYIASKAFEALPPEVRPPKEQAIGMRWILTWKTKEDGDRKAKARAILKGFQDPEYEHRATTTPVMTRQSRQIILQMSAWQDWKVKKGDVTGAFLQGREYPGNLFCIPCPEILDGMGLSRDEVVRVKRGCYGLVDAPLEWYRTISAYFEEIGLIKSWTDPCCWLWKPNGAIKGMIAGHVDDFLFAGPKEDKAWKEIENKIQTHFKWSEWEENSFVQCGVLVEAQPDGSYTLSQEKYVDKISEIQINSGRRKEKNSPTNEREKGQMRAALGSLSWHAQQVAPHVSAEVGILLSEVSGSTVETLIRTNILIQNVKSRRSHKMIIHSFPKETPLGVFAWADAAGQNRRDGSSTQGIFVGMAPMTLLSGHVEKVTPIAWHASKIDRVCRSPGAAEAVAVVNGEDYLFHVRYQLGELFDKQPNVFDVDTTVNRFSGVLISDSRNVYDKLQTEELSIKGAERRTDIELLCLKSAQRNNHVTIRWVHSEAQIANALTKGGAKEFDLYYQMKGTWRIVQDEEMRSSRRRRSDGITTFQQNGDKTEDKDPKENSISKG